VAQPVSKLRTTKAKLFVLHLRLILRRGFQLLERELGERSSFVNCRLAGPRYHSILRRPLSLPAQNPVANQAAPGLREQPYLAADHFAQLFIVVDRLYERLSKASSGRCDDAEKLACATS